MDYDVILIFHFNCVNIYDIYAQDGNTALMRACIERNFDVLKVLLQAGANIDIQDKVRNNVM